MAAKPGKRSNVLVWVVMAILVFALGGFGIGNFGGSVRSIGAVGETEITVEEYALALQSALRARAAEAGQAIPVASPLGQIVADGVRRQLIGTAALEGEAARLGLSVGDEAVRREVVATPAFQGLDGQFDRAAYAETLRRNNLGEGAFEDNVRKEQATRLVTAAAVAGVEPPGTMVDTFAAYAGERRDVFWLRLDESALAEPLPAPDADALQAAWEATPEAYTLPETKEITYAALTPETLVEDVAVDEGELRQLYEERAEEYNRPERRLVERLVFPDAAAAEAARAALDAGPTTFEQLVQGRGLTMPDVDLGDVTREALGPAGEAVFALDGPGVVGPLDTPLGPALFRVNAILAAEVTPFEEVRETLLDEAALGRARRTIGELREGIDDLLAGGATLEEVADETEMELGTIAFRPDTADGIAGYAAFREAAAAVSADDFPELIELEDGGLVALRLDAVRPPALQPLDEVRDQVAADWRRAETERRLAGLGATITAARAAGETLEAQGYTPETREDLSRGTFIEDAPDGFREAIFALAAPGEIATAVGDGALYLAELAAITPEDPTDGDAAAIREAIGQAMAEGLAQDMLDLFVAELQAQGGITLNQAAINAVHAQFP